MALSNTATPKYMAKGMDALIAQAAKQAANTR